MVGVRHAFEQADDAGMPWDGGYVFTTYEHYKLPDLFSWVVGGDYEEAVREEIRDCLVEKTYASRWWAETEPDEAFSTAWTEFRDQILHRTRFTCGRQRPLATGFRARPFRDATPLPGRVWGFPCHFGG